MLLQLASSELFCVVRNSSSEENVGSASSNSTAAAAAAAAVPDTGDTGIKGADTGVTGDVDDKHRSITDATAAETGTVRAATASQSSLQSSSAPAAGSRSGGGGRHGDASRDWRPSGPRSVYTATNGGARRPTSGAERAQSDADSNGPPNYTFNLYSTDV